MYAQFFGSYLLSRNAVTPVELKEAISHLSDSHLRLGTIAMSKGYMTAKEVDEVCFLQTREDKHFGEIAVERNYLFDDQLNELLKSQNPDYLLLGQNLVDMGVLTNERLETLLAGYQKENQIDPAAGGDDIPEQTTELVRNFFFTSGRTLSDLMVTYMNLIFNNLVRFIGGDFTPLSPAFVSEYDTNCAVIQRLTGVLPLHSGIDMDKEAAIEFASRYAQMEFNEFDEYVQASLEDFLNLHNGLFSVNMSNTSSKEAELAPPEFTENRSIELSSNAFVVPVIYPFGTVYLILSPDN